MSGIFLKFRNPQACTKAIDFRRPMPLVQWINHLSSTLFLSFSNAVGAMDQPLDILVAGCT